MSDDKSSLLFSKDGNESQEDIWDDTALIRAYEKSVKNIRKKLDSKLVLDTKNKTNEPLNKSKEEETDDENEENQACSGII